MSAAPLIASKDGRFGACLMAEPELVARCVDAVKRAVGIPVTVKCRIGIDDQDPEVALDTLARAVPRVPIIINGGVLTIEEAKAHLAHIDGVMLGRAAYQEPWRLLSVDPEISGGAAPHATMQDAFEAMMPYIEAQLARRTRLHAITRHFVGAFHAVQGARAFRRHLAEHGVRTGVGFNVLRDAIPRIGARTPAEAA